MSLVTDRPKSWHSTNLPNFGSLLFLTSVSCLIWHFLPLFNFYQCHYLISSSLIFLFFDCHSKMPSTNPWSGNPSADDQPTSSSSSSSSQTGILLDPSAPIKARNLVTDEIWREDCEAENGQKDATKPKMAESWGEMIRAWPKTTLCIVSNEFCERFSYYGMRTVLTLYFMNVLKYSSAKATMYFNGFTVLCYLTPLLGCILADGYIGKFKTVFLVSILYTIGQILLALASTQDWNSSFHPWVDILGLVIIGFGTGGIKPCVCSFGGDQFEPYQEKMLSIFFSAFYFAINAGSMISTFISPMFRATPCMGQDSCYPMAFGIPAALMIVATLIFISGSFSYKKLPPKENIFGEVYKASKKAISNRFHSQMRSGHSHWLDFYFDTHFCASDARCQELQRKKRDPRACHKRQFIADIKGLLRLLVMYLPAPMFWALYDQQGSRWLIQSVNMDCRVPLPWGGEWFLLPDQMQTLNAVLILLFIPIFQAIIYPLVAKCFKITPLRKMVAGGLLAALAFVVSAAVQFEVNYSLPDTPIAGHSFMSAINAFPTGCNMTICAMKNGNEEQCRFLGTNQILTNLDTSKREMFELAATKQQQFKIRFEGNETKCPTNWTAEYELDAGQTYWMLVGGQGVVFGRIKTDKPTEGTGVFNIGITLALDDLDGYEGNLALCRMQPGETNKTSDDAYCNPNKAEDFYLWKASEDLISLWPYQNSTEGKSEKRASIYAVKSVRQGNWALFLMKNGNVRQPTGVEFSIQTQGGVYMLALTGSLEKKPLKQHLFHVVPDNGVSILWQVPQIAIITAAEILFSITGYEFAYSQAAPSMKSVVQALWLLTTATGDAIIIVVVAIFQFSDLAKEFVFYAVGMFLVTILLALLAIFYYEYNNYTGEEDDRNEKQQKSTVPEEEWTRMKGRKSVQMFGSNEELDGSTTKKSGQVNEAFGASANTLDEEGEEKGNKQK